eukprot:4017307-Alexandrium_andersonii.AAC.1
MSASLVGSEMCIRDSWHPCVAIHEAPAGPGDREAKFGRSRGCGGSVCLASSHRLSLIHI